MDLFGKKVLVTGGTGFIGGRLVEKLCLEHHADVRVLVRNFSNASRIARFNLEMIKGDTTVFDDVNRAIQHCDVVLHCAYDFSASTVEREKNTIKSTENIAKAVLRNNSRLVHISTVDVYGRPLEGEITEKTPKNPTNDIYAQTKYIAEKIFLDYYHKQNLPVSVIQPTIVYGPYSRPWTHTPVQQLKNGRVALVNGGEGCCNAVYIDDVIDSICTAAVIDEAIGECFLISGKEPITWGRFYQGYEDILDVNSTISMSISEISDLEKLKITKGKSNIKEIKSLFLDEYIQRSLMKIPIVKSAYDFSVKHLPRPVKEKIKISIQTNSEKISNMEKSSDLIMPDENKLKLFQSIATVSIVKARKILNYEPKYSFNKGMELTSKYLDWANMIPSS